MADLRGSRLPFTPFRRRTLAACLRSVAPAVTGPAARAVVWVTSLVEIVRASQVAPAQPTLTSL